MHFTRRLLAALMAALVLNASAQVGDLPELGDVASTELSLATEKKIGQEIMNQIRWRDPSYLDDMDVEAYLNQLGGRLAAVSNDPGIGFFFFPINDPSINAFAMPGGYIGVHTGLILVAQSEGELAGVLAHEIAHVTQRHIARQVFQSQKLGMAAMLAMGLALIAARSNSQVAGAAVAGSQAGAISAQLAFSRDFERESDRVGFETLRRAGFDVRGMSGFFGRLQKAVRLYENNATAYLRTHPLTGERLADMQNRELGQPYKQVTDSPDFLLIRAKLGAIQGTADDAVRQLRGQLAERKFASEAATQFGLAVALMRQRQWAEAEKLMGEVRKSGVSAPVLDRLLAEVRIEQGAVDEGLRRYREAMQRFPTNAAMIYGYAGNLLRAKRFPQALEFLKARLVEQPTDIRLHQLKAECYAGMGRKALQYAAQGEVLDLQGQTMAALEQLNLAQRAKDADFYEMSAIDSRQRQLKQRLIEELRERRK